MTPATSVPAWTREIVAGPENLSAPKLRHVDVTLSVSVYVPSYVPAKSAAGGVAFARVSENVPVVDVVFAPATVPLIVVALIVAVTGNSNEPVGSNAAPLNVDPEIVPAAPSCTVSD